MHDKYNPQTTPVIGWADVPPENSHFCHGLNQGVCYCDQIEDFEKKRFAIICGKTMELNWLFGGDRKSSFNIGYYNDVIVERNADTVTFGIIRTGTVPKAYE